MSSCMYGSAGRNQPIGVETDRHHPRRRDNVPVDSSTDYGTGDSDRRSLAEQPWSRRLPQHAAAVAVSNRSGDIFGAQLSVIDGSARSTVAATKSASAAISDKHQLADRASSLTAAAASAYSDAITSCQRSPDPSTGCSHRLRQNKLNDTRVASTASRRSTSRTGKGPLNTAVRSSLMTAGPSGRNINASDRRSSCGRGVSPSAGSQRVRPAYKHIPHRDKPPHLVARRNARERRRVQAVNGAFVRLRRHLPVNSIGKNKRLSKVKTLRIAIEYISHLQKTLADDLTSPPGNIVGFCHEHSSPLHIRDTEFRPQFDDEDDIDEDYDDLDLDNEDDDISTTSTPSLTTWSNHR